MSNFVKVVDGVVVQRQPYDEDGFIEATDDVICGWLNDGVTFSMPVALEPEPVVPQEVTMGQCRLALFDKHGIETDEEFLALTDMLPEVQRARARLELRTRPTVRFDSPLVQGLCAAMGWNVAELFIYADAQ